MRVLARTGWICGLLATLLPLTFSAAHNHSGEAETHYVSAGHLHLLSCRLADAHVNVTWSRAGRQNVSLPSGVEVRAGRLWFLPVQTSHEGTYTCEKRYKTGSKKMNFGLSVSAGGCPDPSENISIPRKVNGGLPCKQLEIFRLNYTRSIRWMKDCHPVEPSSLDEEGYMRLLPASEEDAGKYTCLVDVSFNGRSYTAARSIQLSIKKDLSGTIIEEPKLLYPQQEVVVVEVAPDGKLYDGYVSFLRPGTLSSSEMANFALQILPEELEKKHGFSLYIRGRDDCPGEASHDTIAATLHQCRRLMIILSPDTKSPTDSKTEEMSPLCDDQHQLCYEQKIGIYDALTQNDARVILVEIGGPVDYSHLPESLHYIKRKQGALKWENASKGSHSLSKLHANRKFWKNLRYHMPSVPAGEHQTII